MALYYTLQRKRHLPYSRCMNTLADFVRDARDARGMTQEELAEAIGKSFGYIGQLETGKIGRPRAATLRRLAAALHVPLADLVVATGQLDASEGDAAANLLRIAALPTPAARLAAWRELPEPLRAAILVLMRDVFQAAALRLEELTD